MKLQDKAHKFPPFDVASGMAPALLATGEVEVYKERTFNVGGGVTKPGQHITTFNVRAGQIVEDVQFPPFITYTCGDCGQGRIEGPNAHKQRVMHRPPKGFSQDVPSAVAVEFIQLRKRWEKLKRS